MSPTLAFIRRNCEAIALVVAGFIFRSLYLLKGVVPFAFDHGKDSLAIMDMIMNLSPKLVGPWTSIQGLYSGAGWYYLLAPFYLLFGLSPLAGAWSMVFLAMLQIIIAYKYLGKYEAVIFTFAPLWMIMSRSAWNPYPIILISMILIVLFLRSQSSGKLNTVRGVLIGITASLGFHFCAAYAVFYPIVIFQVLLLLKIKLPIKSLISLGVGFLIPFLPQLLFEVKNNFVETKAVIHYFSQGEPHAFSLEKITHVLQTTAHETLLGFIPEMTYLGKLAWPIALILLGLLGWYTFKHVDHDAQLRQRLSIAFSFTFVPVLGFFFLHFNLWYIYAIVPAVVAVVGQTLTHSPKWFRVLFIVLLIAGQVAWLLQFWSKDQVELAHSRGFLPTQLETLEIIRREAGQRSFASYHYVRDIYDFTYQYLYFWQAFHGERLPTEFSYQSGEVVYLVQKNDLLQLLPQDNQSPELIFYVVEKPDQPVLLQEWWYRQPYSNIVKTIPVGPDVTIYVGQVYGN